MEKYQVRVQKGDVATTPEHARQIAEKLNNQDGLVVKAQVHAGGRGKGTLSSGLKGGVHILKTPDEVFEISKKMLGFNLTTQQTKPGGLKVDAVLVGEGLQIVKSFYLAFVLDRNSQKPALVVSTEGGVEIEHVAKTRPEKILQYPFDYHPGLTAQQYDDVITKLGLNHMKKDAMNQIASLYSLFSTSDCMQLEINPWSTGVENNKLFCVDAKINIDDNAKFRQKELVEMRSHSLGTEDVDPHEEKALAAGLSYVALDGNIGCLVNGAGLAMATMDIIKLYGEEPANFLDVGGGATVEQCQAAFEILSQHPKVKCIFVNIFGGILSCKTIAEGISKAAQIVKLSVPLVVRLSGNAAEQGRQTLNEFSKNHGFNIQVADNMEEGAKLAAQIVKQQKK